MGKGYSIKLMQELEEKVDNEIRELVQQEDKILSEVMYDIVKDYAYLWNHIDDFRKIRKVLIQIVRLFLIKHPGLKNLPKEEQLRFKYDFDELLTNPRYMLYNSKKYQIKAIEGQNPKKWFIKFQNDISDILYIIAKETNKNKFSGITGELIETNLQVPFLLKVPFYPQGMDECGPYALRMVLKYFGYDLELQRVKQLCYFGGIKGTSNTGIARGAAKMGLGVECYFKTFDMSDDIFLTSEYFKKHSEEIPQEREKIQKLLQEAEMLGVKFYKKYIPTDEVLSRLNKDTLATACVDSSKLNGFEKTGISHIVVIVGYNYDKNIIFINDPEQKPYRKIGADVFEKARQSPAVDGDIVMIYRK